MDTLSIGGGVVVGVRAGNGEVTSHRTDRSVGAPEANAPVALLKQCQSTLPQH